jgi:hypothetical protein
MMKCTFCGAALRGIDDTRTLTVAQANRGRHSREIAGGRHDKVVVCRDIDACNARVAEQERRRVAGE